MPVENSIVESADDFTLEIFNLLCPRVRAASKACIDAWVSLDLLRWSERTELP
jgi:hypothetical protein